MNNKNNVFSGPSALRDFLDPRKNFFTPLVELPTSLNPFAKDKVRIFAKLMYLTPLLNIKQFTAFNMLLDAAESGGLEGIHTLIENSSGNMAFSLAILAPLFGIENVKAIVPIDIPYIKKEMLNIAGAELIFSKEIPGELSGIALAKKMGEEKGFLNLGQYEKHTNPKAHEKWTAEQIWTQTKGKITVFCAGLGTTGTIVGARQCFEKKSSKVALVGVMVAPGHAVPGVRSRARLAEIKFDWEKDVNLVEAEAKESFEKSLKLLRSGVIAGPSSGFAFSGLLKFLESKKRADELEKLRNKDGEVVAVFVCGDLPNNYFDKYFTHLNPQDF
ncbi:MAG: pyridoxal-phosphate dependent enzyme [Patescibacteria group bacterium]|nr:pyridoxal-phosphate dependent enzyme [Patescibacteria group bacterium]